MYSSYITFSLHSLGQHIHTLYCQVTQRNIHHWFILLRFRNSKITMVNVLFFQCLALVLEIHLLMRTFISSFLSSVANSFFLTVNFGHLRF